MIQIRFLRLLLLDVEWKRIHKFGFNLIKVTSSRVLWFLYTGTIGTPGVSARLQAAAVYIANLFLLTSDTTVQIIKDIDVDPDTVG